MYLFSPRQPSHTIIVTDFFSSCDIPQREENETRSSFRVRLHGHLAVHGRSLVCVIGHSAMASVFLCTINTTSQNVGFDHFVQPMVLQSKYYSAIKKSTCIIYMCQCIRVYFVSTRVHLSPVHVLLLSDTNKLVASWQICQIRNLIFIF